MKLVERHIIKVNNPIWTQIDKLCFLSKNLYNYANYLIRQSFIVNKIYLSYERIYHLVKNQPDYQALPRKVSQQILKVLERNWQSFFQTNKAYQETPSKFTGRPKLPRYKHKINGRNLLIYTIQAISKKWMKQGKIQLSGTDILISTQAKNIAQVRIVPQRGQYVIEVIYQGEEYYYVNNPNAIAAIDIGVDNLAALTSNQLGFVPILINGRPLKSINQFYNKRKACLQSLLPKKQTTSKLIQKIGANRNNRVDTYLHQTSRWIIDHLVRHGIGSLIVGKNPLWKQEVNNGRANNQAFVSIPHARFIEMLIYKGAMKGIKVITKEESYTSRASFLNLDPIPNYGDDDAKNVLFSGYRETRGLYKIKGQKTRINADLNASYNILRKVVPTAFSQGIEGAVVRPIGVTPGVAKI
jgi:putative transposase